MKRIINIIANMTWIFIQIPYHAVKETLIGIYHEGVLYDVFLGKDFVQDIVNKLEDEDIERHFKESSHD